MTRGGHPPIVLVPGAWLGGWAWRDVARRLRAAGHDVFPATLTGLGERVHLAHPQVDLEAHIADIVNLLDYEGLADATLVGHSYAGIVITGVADRRPERLGALVYLDTSPVPDGFAIIDALSAEQRERQERDVREHGDGWRWPVVERETLASGMFGSAAGLNDAQLAIIEDRGTAQPYATFTSRLHLARTGEAPTYRRAMIIGTSGGMTAAMLRALIEQGDPRAAALSAPDWDLHELATGHWAMLSSPDSLAELLHRIAAAAAR